MSKLLSFILLSLALHALLILFDASSPSTIYSARNVVGLVERPLAQFIGVAKPQQPFGGAAKLSQSTPATSVTASVRSKRPEPVSSDPSALKIPPIQDLLQVPKSPSAATVDRVQPASPIEETVAVPAEGQLLTASTESEPTTHAVLSQDPVSGGDNNVSGPQSEEFYRVKAGGGEFRQDTSAAIPGFRDALPRYELNPRPQYPEAARRRGQQGTVLLRVLLRADGLVEKASFLESSGYKSLDRAALIAVRRWQFQPATLSGLPVSSRVVVPIDFVLNGN